MCFSRLGRGSLLMDKGRFGREYQYGRWSANTSTGSAYRNFALTWPHHFAHRLLPQPQLCIPQFLCCQNHNHKFATGVTTVAYPQDASYAHRPKPPLVIPTHCGNHCDNTLRQDTRQPLKQAPRSKPTTALPPTTVFKSTGAFGSRGGRALAWSLRLGF
jgi:hypothetical protein